MQKKLATKKELQYDLLIMKKSSFIKISHKTILFILSCVFTLPVYASYLSDLKFYTGFSAGYQYVGFKPGYGEGFMPNNSVDYELFLGYQGNNHFGFETGFTVTPKINKYSTLYAGDYYPGATRPLAPGMWQTWNPQYENAGFYFGVNRYFPIMSKGNLRGFAFVGLTYVDVHMVTNFIADDLGVAPPDDVDAALTTYEASKIIPMIKIGVEQNFNQTIGWRAAYTWKNYAAFGKIHSLEYPSLPIAIMPKNTNALYLSVFAIF